VIWATEVAELVDDDVLEHRARRDHEPPGERERAARRARPPARALVGDPHTAVHHAEPRRLASERRLDRHPRPSAVPALGALAVEARRGDRLALWRVALAVADREAKGLDGALFELARQPYGRVLLAAVAVGLGCYALWALVQARYRDT
jgi:hypothetical protein